MAKSSHSKSKKQNQFIRVEYFFAFVPLLISLLVLAAYFLFAFKNETGYTQDIKLGKENGKKIEDHRIDIKPSFYPQKKEGSVEPVFTAKAVMAIDLGSGTVLYQKNEETPLWPASTTKLMTALVVLDNFPLDSVFTVGVPVQDGRIMDLIPDEKITVENLLYGLLVHSANDAAFALAENYPGGMEVFVSEMNKKALELSLENTHFVNPAGFDDVKQYSTAKDLARLSVFALKNKTIAKIVSTPAITVHDVDFKYFHPLTTVNKLLGVVPGVAGVKTGWTENAKENLINLTKRDEKEILTVVLGSDDRFSETQILTDWVFNSFSWLDFSYQPKKDQ